MKPATKPLAAFLATLPALLAGCGEPMATPPAPSLKPQCGYASYYHGSLAGNLTANGETYDPKRLTAAHLTLPFETELLVRRRDGDEKVRVRINDRGPYVDDRIIDLSPAAAKKIGIFGEDGVAEVCLVLES